jgi:hypothetical protein
VQAGKPKLTTAKESALVKVVKGAKVFAKRKDAETYSSAVVLGPSKTKKVRR